MSAVQSRPSTRLSTALSMRSILVTRLPSAGIGVVVARSSGLVPRAVAVAFSPSAFAAGLALDGGELSLELGMHK